MSHLEILESEFQEFQIKVPLVQKKALATYCDEVERWNRKINLTGLSGVPLVRRLVAEPAWVAGQLGLSGTLIDIGSGNGSPAIPFLIVSGLTTACLIEARVKRAVFLRHLAQLLHLPLEVHRARVEDVAAAEGLVKPDWISLQGVSPNKTILASIWRFAKPTTKVIWITSAAVQTDLSPLQTLIVPISGTRVVLLQRDLS